MSASARFAFFVTHAGPELAPRDRLDSARPFPKSRVDRT